MSGVQTPEKAPKAMSSRLLTMKFMQRAAASSAPTSPLPPSTPDSLTRNGQRSVKSSPVAFDVNALANEAAVAAAIASEEAKRQAVLDRQADEAGDTRWVLNFKNSGSDVYKQQLRVVRTGYASIDNGSDPSATPGDITFLERPTMAGRRSFGKFNRKIERLQDPNRNDSDSSSDEEEDDDDIGAHNVGENTEDDPTSEFLKTMSAEAALKARADRKGQRKAEKAELKRLAEARNRKAVNLNSLSSISASSQSGMTCFKCGESGHVKAECPNKRKSDYNNDSAERTKKARKSR